MPNLVNTSMALALALGTGLVVGCAVGAEPAPETLDVQSSAIIGGTADREFDSVVLLSVSAGNTRGACTGTLVAPNLVLTARHCVSNTDEGVVCKVDGTPYSGGQITSDASPRSISVYAGRTAVADVGVPGRAAARGAQVITETTTTLCDRDIAFVVLDTSVDGPIAALRLDSGAREGESLTAVGWGLTEEGVQPDVRQRRDGVRVAAVGPVVLDSATNIGLGEAEFAVREAICSGDSGGPSFSAKGAVVGVVSRGGGGSDTTSTNRAAGCIGDSAVNFYTQLATKPELVAKAFSVAGHTPLLEGTATGKAKGTSCSANSECTSTACVDGECVARCDGAGACASGETCTTKQALRVCLMSATSSTPSVAPTGGSNVMEDKGGCNAGAGDGTWSSMGVVLASLILARRRRPGRPVVGVRQK